MAGRTVGSVSVTVVPDAQTFSTLLRAQIVPQASALGEGIGKELSRAIAKGISDGIKDGVVQGGAGLGPAGTKQGNDFGSAFATSFRSRVDAAIRSLPDIQLDADSTPAATKITSIRRQLEELNAKTIGIEITDFEALEKLEQLRRRLAEVKAESGSIQVRADTAAAIAELDRIILKAQEVARESPDIKVDADTGEANASPAETKAAADSAGGGFSGLLTAGLALGPALIPVIGSIATALAGLASVAGAVGVALAVSALAFSDVSKTVKDLSGEETRKDRATASGSSGTAAKVNQDALANANAQLIASEESLKNVRLSAADAAVRAAETVKNAKRSEEQAEDSAATASATAARRTAQARETLASAIEASSAAIQSAENNQVTAERGLTDAQGKALDAQTALTEARKTAQQQQEDLANQVIDGINSQRDAQFQLQDAQSKLIDVNRPGSTTSDEDKQKAQLAFDEANQRVNELTLANQRLADQKAAADKAGIDGSNLVTAATKAVADANQAVVDAQQKVTDSTTAVTKAQVDGAKAVAKAQADLHLTIHDQAITAQQGAESVIKAQQAITDAMRAQATQQRQSAFSVQQALEAVANAQRAVGVAEKPTGGSKGSAGVPAFDQYAESLAKTDPAVRSFAQFVIDKLQPALQHLKDSAAEGLLPGLKGAIDILLPSLPAVNEFVKSIAAGLGKLAVEGAKALKDPEWQAFFELIKSQALPTIDQFVHIVGNLALGFAGLLRAFLPATQDLGGGLVALSQRFAEFGEKANDPKSGFQSFLSYIRTEGPKVVDTFGNIFGAIGNLADGLAPYGAKVLDFISTLFGFIKTADPDVLGKIAEAALGVALAFQGFKLLSPILSGVTKLIEGIGPALTFLTSPLGLTVLAVAGLAAGFVILYENSQTFRDFVHDKVLPVLNDIWSYIQDKVVPILKKDLAQAIDGAKQAFGGIVSTLNDPDTKKGLLTVLGIVVKAFQTVIDFVVNDFLPTLGPQAKAGFLIVGGIIDTFIVAIGLIGDAWGAVAAAIGGHWGTVYDYFVSGINSVINLIDDFIRALNNIPGVSIPIIAQITSSKPPNTTVNHSGGHGPGGAAGGAVLPGYAPGVDSIHIMASPGEAILVPELTAMIGPETIMAMNAWASRGRASNSSPTNGHYSIGGIIGDIAGAGGHLLGAVVGPAERAAIGTAASAAHVAVNHTLPSGFFRNFANGFITKIGDELKFADGGIVGSLLPSASIPYAGGGPSGPLYSYDGQPAMQPVGQGNTYQVHVVNTGGRQVTGQDIVTGINQTHAIHGGSLLAGIGHS